MGSRVVKEPPRKAPTGPITPHEEPPPKPRSPQLNHGLLAGKGSAKSTVVDGAVMVELSLRRETRESPKKSGCGRTNSGSPDPSDSPEIVTTDATAGYRVRSSSKKAKSMEIMALGDVAITPTAAPDKIPVSTIHRYAVHTLLGRQGRIKVVRLSPDGSRLVCGSNEETSLVLYELPGGKELFQFNGHSDQAMTACFSPDGKSVCSASRDKTTIVWDSSTGKQLNVLCHESLVMCCDFSADGQFIAAGCIDRACKVWDAHSGQQVMALSIHSTMVVAVAFSPDSSSVCSASADRTLLVWDIHTGRRRFALVGHTGAVLSCAFTTDNARIVSNDEKTLRIWSADDGRLLDTWGMESRVLCRKDGKPLKESRPEMKFIASAVAPGPYIVASVNNKVVMFLDPNTGQEVLSFFFKASVYTLATGTANTVALGDAHGNIHVIQLTFDADLYAVPKSALRGQETIPLEEE